MTFRPGIFESVFPAANLDRQFEVVRAAGFQSVQFDFASAGIDPWQQAIEPGVVAAIRASADRAGVAVPAASGTYNMAHPDADVRRAGHTGLVAVIEAAPGLGASFVTLCTGSRSRESMWRSHPDNDTALAWSDSVDSIRQALVAAEQAGVTLLVEPEPANVIGNARLARTLLDEIGSNALKIVLDPANVVLSDRTRDPAVVLSEAFELLGPDIVFAHAKDLSADGEFCAAGTGVVPWDHYWNLLAGIDYQGDVIFHTLTEADVPRALALLPTAA